MSATARAYVELHPWGVYTALIGASDDTATLRQFSPGEMIARLLLIPPSLIKPIEKQAIRLARREVGGKEVVDLMVNRGTLTVLNHWPHGLPEGVI